MDRLRIVISCNGRWEQLVYGSQRSNKSVLHLVCKIDKCKWKLIAVRRDEGTYFQVRSYESEHSYPLEEVHRRHRQVSTVIIGEVIAHRLQQHNGHLMRLKDIMTDMKIMFGIQVMYSKAHAGLSYAIILTYGSHEETFQHLSTFGYVLEQQNSGTVIELQCMEDNKFLYFFMALGASIKCFRRCMRLVIAVDDTFLKRRFRGTMFVATTQDSNEQAYPIAFGYGDSENNASWEWFLDSLKGALGHIDDLVFIFD
ncbi:hypothetical protein Dsin_021857 [Dipteronia sinensis]|uniref:MULE transposase domain-containing protein n=1 Tax=Dipteronia sinensis TaxID=43782 RepID=A0AAE0A1F4_9ROSI|nr:hypothetical protein Dsin_021857 [Dipteronia sinensis]